MELKHAGVLLLVVLMSACSGSAKVIYVDDDATRANDGTSWANAYKYVEDGLVRFSIYQKDR